MNDQIPMSKMAVSRSNICGRLAFGLVLPHINTVTYRGRRGARSARREEGEYSIVFDRRATQQTGMHRQPNAIVFM